MKKLFLGLIATVLFCFAGNAQNGSYSKSSMVVVVAAAKGSYTKGMSYKEWLKNQTAGVTPAKEEEKFLSDIFSYLSTGANSENILKTYDGKSFVDLLTLSSKDGLKVIKEGNLSEGNRFCWFCLIKVLVDFACTYIVDCNPTIHTPVEFP